MITNLKKSVYPVMYPGVPSMANESMVSFVSRRYMRGENGQSVLLIRIGKQNVKIIYI